MKVNKTAITRGHDKRIEKRQFKYRSTMNSFIPRATNAWNALPSECVDSKTVNSFKSNLNSAWKVKANKFTYNF